MTIDERRNDTAKKYRNLLVQCKKCKINMKKTWLKICYMKKRFPKEFT